MLSDVSYSLFDRDVREDVAVFVRVCRTIPLSIDNESCGSNNTKNKKENNLHFRGE